MVYSPRLTIDIARRRCAEKKQYMVWEQAEVGAYLLAKAEAEGRLPVRKQGEIRAYKCAFGNHWHVGHHNAKAEEHLRYALKLEQEGRL